MKVVRYVGPCLLLVSFSCAHAAPCGNGSATRLGDANVCAYESDVVIVSGFDCPDGYPVRLDGAGGTLCGDAWVDPNAPGACDAVGGCDGLRLHVTPSAPGCEELDPIHCLAPWPSDRFLDESGHVELPIDALTTAAGGRIDRRAWARSDGFAPSTPIVVQIEGTVDASALADEDHIATSTTDASPTIVLDVSESPPVRVAHVAEVDGWGASRRTTLWLRPLALPAGHRFVVAVRTLRRPAGAPIPPPVPFHALRDGVPTDDPALEARRASFEREVLGPLADAGVSITSLHLAWSFRTSSEAAIARDVSALSRTLGASPTCRLGSVALASDGWRTLRGTFESPNFLADESPMAPFARDSEDVPALQSISPRELVVAIPPTVGTPERVLVLTHVQSGSAQAVIARPEWRHFAMAEGAVLVATDLRGTTEVDVAATLDSLAVAPEGLATTAERSLQAALDVSALARALPSCAAVPELAPFIDPADVYLVALESSASLVPAVIAMHAPVRGIVTISAPGSFAAWARRSSTAMAVDDALAAAYPDAADRALFVAAIATPWQSLETVGGSSLGDTRLLALSLSDSTRAPPLLARMTTAAWALPLLVPSVEAPQLEATVSAPASRGWVAAAGGLSRVAPGASPPPFDRGLESSLPYAAPISSMLDAFLHDGGAISGCGGACAL